MKTIILNGSPKGNSAKSNSRIICEEFVRKMKSPCEIRNIANSDMEELARYVEKFDNLIFVLPLYIHAMPGIMLEFIKYLRKSSVNGKSMGFIIQAGFIETQQHKYVEPYFASLAEQLHYNYLGTVSKGEAAAIYMFPNMFKKVLLKYNELGRIYERTNAFDEELKHNLGKPYEFTKFQLQLYEFICITGLNNLGWHKVLKKNQAYEKRLEKPFLNKI